MKSFALVSFFGLAMSLTAQAAPLTLKASLEPALTGSAYSLRDVRFVVTSEEHGRARLEVKLERDAERESETVKAFVDGLFFDKTTSEIVYQSGDKRVVCATRGGTFGNIKPTGNCVPKAEFREVPFDNRDDIIQVTKLFVTLSVN